MEVPGPGVRTGQGQVPFQFRFVQDFYAFHDTSRQTFAKYYNRYRLSGSDNGLLPLKRGPKWRSRRTLPFIEEKVLELRRKGVNRYEAYAILEQTLKSHTPAPSTIYAIFKRHGLNRLTKPMKQSKRQIIKTRAGELGHLDCHYLSRDLIVGDQGAALPGVRVGCLHPVGMGGDGGRPQEPDRDVLHAQEHQPAERGVRGEV